ncbi:MAG: DMT family transporter [Bacteroidota bacterium]
MDNKKVLAWSLLLLLATVWGSSFILMKLGLVAFSATQMATLRIVIAALTLTPVLILRWGRLKDITRKQYLLMFLIGLAGNALPAFLFAEAETVIPSAIAGVLNSLNPLFVLIIAFAFFRKRFPFINVVGVLIGVTGAIILITAGTTDAVALGDGAYLRYSLLVILATFNYALSANILKHYFSNFDPVLLTTVALVSVGYPAIFYLLAGSGVPAVMETHPAAWSSLGYIAILGAIGTAVAVILFNRLLQISSLVFATSVTYLIPIVALTWGILDGENLVWQQGLGFAVILSGVYLVNRK